jgi:NADH-quinone oxidoreductase subunit G
VACDSWNDKLARLVVGGDKGPVFVLSPHPLDLDGLACRTVRAMPDELARLAQAIAANVDPRAGSVDGLSAKDNEWVHQMSDALVAARKPLIIAGCGCASEKLLKAAANLVWALVRKNPKARIALMVPESNSLGAALLSSRSLAKAQRQIKNNEVETLIVLENDLSRRLPADDLDDLLKSVRHVVVLDHLEHLTSERAGWFVPVGNVAESSGTLVNSAGMAQRFCQVFQPGDDVAEDWRWLLRMEQDRTPEERMPLKTLGDVRRTLAAEFPRFAFLSESVDSMGSVPRQSWRHSGRCSMQAHLQVAESESSPDRDSPLAFSMEGSSEGPATSHWAPGWNSVQAVFAQTPEALDVDSPSVWLDGTSGGYFEVQALGPKPRTEELLLLPGYDFFASGELISHVDVMAELAPGACLQVNPAQAGMLEEKQMRLIVKGRPVSLNVKHNPQVPLGVGLYPIGQKGVAWIELPAMAKVG